MQALILAAGAGSRMGGRPKGLLELDGEPLLLRHIEALKAAGWQRITVVLGYYAEAIEPILTQRYGTGSGITLVFNPAPEVGQVSSLRLGLSVMAPVSAGVLVVLSDQPLLTAADFSAIKQVYQDQPQNIQCVVPWQNGVPGNPVALGPQAVAAILAGDAQLGGKQWQAAHPEQVYLWPAPNRHYFVDVDTPQDLESLAAQWGSRLSWPSV